jgi:RNA polymerase sigma-70 factor (ECF subfamily)
MGRHPSRDLGLTPTSSQEVTRLLRAWSRGDEAALEALIPLIYRELRQRAHRYMRRERPGHTLQTTALINEAYLRLAGSAIPWESRNQFFAIAARMMRRILVDHARTRRSLKRGGEGRPVSLDEEHLAGGQPDRDLVSLDESLDALATLDPRKVRVVELRFFGGLSVEETAEALKVSPQTVMRDWKLAKVWLLREMKRGGCQAPGAAQP